ncbi:uncharacterized protein AMSG_06281 [Thecamonas trahens ATCC 50062]|uniref:Uncharacterized protein n=1 Tax=Thecamonas trahens ATCC 50062 TaxID=461836 RepID=A0A0L0DD63_THETB|nr:hypothetical protein AMSG_06281 [Thecamonas trahens ATCC 50062]KNC50145.1 hypothetical protein AMSG_06281 [Thecamonas trahens ATCC 50062]|eukprot:XP_013756993.1 hypothetical protein AMSG_06281 [Thecamonas trahens ATCC 50062]
MNTTFTVVALLALLALSASADELTFCNYISGEAVVLTNGVVTSETTGTVNANQCVAFSYTAAATLQLQLKKASDGALIQAKSYVVPSDRSDRRVFAVRSSGLISSTSFELQTLASVSKSADKASVVVINQGLDLTSTLSMRVGASVNAAAYLGLSTVAVDTTADVKISAETSAGAEVAATTITQAQLRANAGKTIVSVLIGSESSAGSTTGSTSTSTSTSTSSSTSGSTSGVATTARAIETRSSGSLRFETTDENGNSLNSAASFTGPNSTALAIATIAAALLALIM